MVGQKLGEEGKETKRNMQLLDVNQVHFIFILFLFCFYFVFIFFN